MSTLDVDAVRIFVTVAELRSFTKAAAALGSTQGAISVKLKRLEDRLGHKLIERTPRLVRLSAHGAAFLGGAREFLAAHERAVAGLSSVSRRFALGVAGHVAGPELPSLLTRLRAHDPTLLIEVRIDSPRSLMDAFDGGTLDAAIIRREDDKRDGEVLAQEHYGWFAAPGFDYRRSEPLRVAALAANCGVRDSATHELDLAGVRWTEVFVGGSSSILAAVSAGFAVAPLSYRVAPANVVDVGERFGLPSLAPSEILLHASLSDRRSRATLRALAAAFRDYHELGGGATVSRAVEPLARTATNSAGIALP